MHEHEDSLREWRESKADWQVALLTRPDRSFRNAQAPPPDILQP
jgi:hypothetical protein